MANQKLLCVQYLYLSEIVVFTFNAPIDQTQAMDDETKRFPFYYTPMKHSFFFLGGFVGGGGVAVVVVSNT